MKIRSILLSAVIAAGCIFGTTGCKGSSSVGNIGEITFAEGDKIAQIEIEGFGTIKAKLFPDLAPNAVDNFTKLAEQGYYDGLKIHRVAADSMIQGGSLNGDGTGGKAIINEQGWFGVETSDLARNFYGALCYANTSGQNTSQFYIVNNKTPQDITQFDPKKIREMAASYTAQKEGLDASSPKYAEYTYFETYYNSLAGMIEKASDEVKQKYMTAGGYPLWDGGYTVFGQVVEGFEVIDAITAVKLTTDNSGKQTKPVTDIIISTVTVTDYAPPTTEEAESSKTQTTTMADSATPTEEADGTSSEETATAEPDGNAE